MILMHDKTYKASYEFLFAWYVPCIHEEFAPILHSNIVPLATSLGEDLSKIDNENLRNIIAKDPKYREQQSINWKYNFQLLIDSMEDYAKKWTKREKEEVQNESKLLGCLFKFE